MICNIIYYILSIIQDRPEEAVNVAHVAVYHLFRVSTVVVLYAPSWKNKLVNKMVYVPKNLFR